MILNMTFGKILNFVEKIKSA